MQSHLEAALLGHGSSTSASVEDDDKYEHFEENEDVDEFIDEVLSHIYLFSSRS